MRLLLSVITLLISSTIYSSEFNLDEVSHIADSICGKSVTSGHRESQSTTYNKDSIPPELLKELQKKLGDQIIIDVDSVTISTTSFSGPKHEDVAEYNSKVMDCRKKVGMAAIKSQMDSGQQDGE